MSEMLLGLEPAHVFATVIVIGGAILGFMFKINRCVGRHEGQQTSMQGQLDRISEAFLNHLNINTKD